MSKEVSDATGNSPGEPSARRKRLKMVVGIATAGRKEIVGCAIELIARQTRLPDSLIICPATAEDLDAAQLERLSMKTKIRIGSRGLAAQRNVILSVTDDADVIVFFDDDFFPQLDYLEQIERIFLENTDVVAVTGRPILDGVNGPGLQAEDALKAISMDRSNRTDLVLASTYGTYGCNMSFRIEPIRQHRVLFDEHLPLYAWQEDIDFSRQLAAFGKIVDANVLRGVHLGAKSGRTSGVRLGYSQIANPIYLIRKGTMSRAYARPLIWRNVLANLGKSMWPEPWIDRRGRLKGNWLALCDLLTGRIRPQRILELV